MLFEIARYHRCDESDASSSQQTNGVVYGAFVCMNALALAWRRNPCMAFLAKDRGGSSAVYEVSLDTRGSDLRMLEYFNAVDSLPS